MTKTAKHLKQATVNLILLKDEHVLLLMRHGTGWADGYLALVAGCVDEGESVTEAMIREAQEEANIRIRPEWLTFGCVLDSQIVGRDYSCVDFFFICTEWEGEITNNEPHKHKDLSFFPISDLPKAILPFSHMEITQALKGSRYGELGWVKKITVR